MTWISVEDRLPELLEKVLFFWDCSGAVKNISMGYRCEQGWNIYLPYHSFGLRDGVCPVTHWMPLPDYPSQGCLCAGANGLGQCNCQKGKS